MLARVKGHYVYLPGGKKIRLYRTLRDCTVKINKPFRELWNLFQIPIETVNDGYATQYIEPNYPLPASFSSFLNSSSITNGFVNWSLTNTDGPVRQTLDTDNMITTYGVTFYRLRWTSTQKTNIKLYTIGEQTEDPTQHDNNLIPMLDVNNKFIEVCGTKGDVTIEDFLYIFFISSNPNAQVSLRVDVFIPLLYEVVYAPSTRYLYFRDNGIEYKILVYKAFPVDRLENGDSDVKIEISEHLKCLWFLTNETIKAMSIPFPLEPTTNKDLSTSFHVNAGTYYDQGISQDFQLTYLDIYTDLSLNRDLAVDLFFPITDPGRSVWRGFRLPKKSTITYTLDFNVPVPRMRSNNIAVACYAKPWAGSIYQLGPTNFHELPNLQPTATFSGSLVLNNDCEDCIIRVCRPAGYAITIVGPYDPIANNFMTFTLINVTS